MNPVRSTRHIFQAAALAVTVGLSALGAACQGCQVGPSSTPGAEVPDGKPTLRLYAVSSVAGALEPCGCSKDQLGGIDHLAAFFSAEKTAASNAWMVSAGPLFFMDPQMSADDRQQTLWKAEAIAQTAKQMNLLAFAPGLNDWAGGNETLAKLREASGATLLAGNLEGAPGAVATLVREVNGVKVGFFGLADPKDKVGRTPDGVKARPAMESAKVAIDELTKQGARVLVGILALPRGDALRLADNFSQISVLVLGKSAEAGDINDQPKPPILLGSTLVVETSNHLQAVGVIDLHVAPSEKKEGAITFQDAGGVAKAEELLSLASRIRDLEQKLNGWEGNPEIPAADIAARKADLEKLRTDKARLEATTVPVSGSFFKYRLVEVRDKLGVDKAVHEQMASFYKRVNEHNKTAFAGRKPLPVEAGQAGYMGVDACTDCHDEERKVWDATGHARAYPTLQKDFKEYNLECVSCHVTGYGKPGGSTVTYSDKLQNVQCEVCHGPGSLHAKDPTKKGLIVLKPAPETCVSECHHPPHVEGFDAAAKMKLILGKGHGM
jgi:2',3'-cyclic-nucleotide 2'-phosphodiesterase (5'-nucleotidase family)